LEEGADMGYISSPGQYRHINDEGDTLYGK